MIAYHANHLSINNTDIYAIRADRTTPFMRLTTDFGRDSRPSWQPLNGRFDAPILEGTPPTILCDLGDRA
jgi:hypothetical protein